MFDLILSLVVAATVLLVGNYFYFREKSNRATIDILSNHISSIPKKINELTERDSEITRSVTVIGKELVKLKEHEEKLEKLSHHLGELIKAHQQYNTLITQIQSASVIRDNQFKEEIATISETSKSVSKLSELIAIQGERIAKLEKSKSRSS